MAGPAGVYATGPPSRAGPPGTGLPRISAVARRAFRGPPGIASRPEQAPRLHEYLSDLVRPWAFPLHPADLAGAGHSYGEMAAPLVAELTSPARPVDLVVLAFAIPDVRPGRATATYLSELCPGHPLAFAICDQGSAAAFTGLRLVAEYARDGGCPRALLLVVEQAGLPYDAGLPVDLPAAHRAVGLRCERTGRARVTGVWQHAGVPPGRAAGRLAADLAGLTGGADLRLIVDEPLAAARDTGGEVQVVPAGAPLTGGWWELAGALAGSGGRPPPGQRLVLGRYDQQLHYLCAVAVETDRL
jgi:4-hydroxymandelate oxidase